MLVARGRKGSLFYLSPISSPTPARKERGTMRGDQGQCEKEETFVSFVSFVDLAFPLR